MNAPAERSIAAGLPVVRAANTSTSRGAHRPARPRQPCLASIFPDVWNRFGIAAKIPNFAPTTEDAP